MKKQNGEKTLYEKEARLLDKVKKITAGGSPTEAQLLEALEELGDGYEKLLNRTIKLIRISDASQRKLTRAWAVEQEKKQLEQIVADRTQEIQDKNRTLETQTNLLKEMAEVKSRFFANISHEFRTPLTLIIGPLEQMLSGPCSKDEEKRLTLMLRNAQRLLGLINQLLELSRFESGKITLQASPQNIIPLLKGITAAIETLAEQKELALNFSSDKKEITLYFDTEKMEEVTYNLLLNAIKFTPPGGRVNISVTENPETDPRYPDGSLILSVTDTGLGIPAARLPHIFDRFYQVRSSREGNHKGSGIGLAIVKELVELHHGAITAQSPAGEGSGGTKFIVKLPLGAAHLSPEEIIDSPRTPYSRRVHADIRELYMTEKEEKENAHGAGVTPSPPEAEIATDAPGKTIILVVDDSVYVRDYIRNALEPHYTVVDAKNGKEGVEKARELIPDLIISDVIMPKTDGHELCRVLKTDVNTSHIPIILLTVKAEEDSIVEGLETGADDYITKPFSTRILTARIKNLIDLRRQLQQTVNREMTLQPAAITVSPIDREFIKELQGVLETNLSDPEFNVEALSKKLYMSRTTLYRKIHALSGETPTEYVRSYRLKRGAELLKKKSASVLEVTLEVGFSNSSYFAKCFKEKFHLLPSEYQGSVTPDA